MIILDTNVVISGFLARHPVTPPALILRAAIARDLPILASRVLLIEYGQTLAKPKILRSAGPARLGIVPMLDRLAAVARVIEPPRCALTCPDPTDQHLWELLAAEPDVLLVTGEHDLVESDHFAGRVLAPRQAIELLKLG